MNPQSFGFNPSPVEIRLTAADINDLRNGIRSLVGLFPHVKMAVMEIDGKEYQIEYSDNSDDYEVVIKA